MLTTTEKLLIAQAFSIYKNELNKIRLYIVTRSGIPLDNLTLLYEEIKKESQKNGYSDPVEYCAQQRLAKMKEIYDKSIQELEIKNIQTDDPESEIEILITPTKYTKPKLDKIYQRENDKSYLIIKNTPSILQSPIVILPKEYTEENKEQETIRPTKHSKRILSRMTELEKYFEEKITELEERFYYEEKDYDMVSSDFKSNIVIKPKSDKIKEDNLKKSLSLEDQYSQIINKYIQNKKNTHDKAQWPGEYKIMVRYLVMLLKEKLPDDSLITKLQKIINEKHEQNLQLAVVKVMEIIQLLIFETEDHKLRKLFNIIKHRFFLLNDFYKK